MCHPQPVKLADNIIEEEMEKKFQNYFTEHKIKNENRESLVSKYLKVLSVGHPQSSSVEKIVNKEFIELHQEEIIEREESVPSYQLKNEKKQSKEQSVSRARRILKLFLAISPFGQNNSGISCGWLKPGTGLNR